MYANFTFLGMVAWSIVASSAGGPFTIDWYSIDGGGVMLSSAGNLELSGTIGQPDAGRLTGGGLTLVGGFWGVAEVAGPPGPCTQIVSSNPPDCAIDGRQPHPIGSTVPVQGFTTVEITLNPGCDASTLMTSDFTLSLTPGPLGPMDIDSVTGAGNVATVMFNQPVPPQNWACVGLVGGVGKSCMGLLPGDVNDSRASNAQDVTALINHLNGVPGQVRPLFKVDMNRSNAANAQDIPQLINLLNGADQFGVSMPGGWLNETIPACPLVP